MSAATGQRTPLRIGFIPLVDAAALLVAVDRGFAAEQGLDIELIREVSWSNVRDKLNLGLFEAAHLLAPLAIASSLGLGHVKVPLVAPFNLGLNGNAVTVSPELYAALIAEGAASGDAKACASALARVVAARRKTGRAPLTFGTPFPFSTHYYQLRFWMAAGGIDPDEDVQMVVLPPPFMVDSLANGHVDGFCVGSPWNSVAVDLGVGRIILFATDILARGAEKVLALRKQWADRNGEALGALIRSLVSAANYINEPGNHPMVADILSKPNRLGVAAEVIMRTLTGRLKVAQDGTIRVQDDYLLIGRNSAARPDPVQAAWLYSQMVRWGQAMFSEQGVNEAKAVFRPDLFDTVIEPYRAGSHEPADGIGAFSGPPFSPNDVTGYLRAFPIGRSPA